MSHVTKGNVLYDLGFTKKEAEEIMGKGSTRRPNMVDTKEFNEAFDRIFGNDTLTSDRRTQSIEIPGELDKNTKGKSGEGSENHRAQTSRPTQARGG